MVCSKAKLVTLLSAFLATLALILALAPQAHADATWEPADFTYGWWAANYENADEGISYIKVDIHPASDTSDRLEVKARAVTGFSDSGLAKFAAGNTDLVIPAKDEEGRQIQAIANYAFQARELDKIDSITGKRITSVAFPEGVLAQNEKTSELWNPTLEKRGNFFIGSSAFLGQNITGSLVLPEGILYVGGSAFSQNLGITEITFPKTIMIIGNSAFSGVANQEPKGSLAQLNFPDETDFPLQIAMQTFAGNQIEAAQLPTNMSAMNALAFFMNKGSGDPVVEGSNPTLNANAKKGGSTIVRIYVSDRSRLGKGVVDKSNFASNRAGVQDVIEQLQLVNGDVSGIAVSYDYTGDAIHPEPVVTHGGKALVKNVDYTVTYGQNTEPGENVGSATVTGKLAYRGSVSKSFTIEPPVPEPEPDPTWDDVAMFTFDKSGTTVTGLTDAGKALLKTAPNMSIPDKGPSGKNITAIGPGAFSTAEPTRAGTFGYKEGDKWYYPTSVTLPSHLKVIGKAAFSGVYESGTDKDGKVYEKVVGGLASVVFPDTLTTIGDAAFNWAPLSRVVLPDSVTSLGKGVFSTIVGAQTKITHAKLPKGLATIPEALFNNQGLSAITIPAGVTSIQRNAFRNNPISKLEIPEKVETIGAYSFEGHALTELDIPASVKSIAAYAFNVPGHNGGSLAKLTLHEGLESIGGRAFQGASLSEVAVPASLTELKTRAFNNNKNPNRDDNRVVLTTSVIDQAKGIGAYANFVPSEVFTAHHGGGHLTQIDISKARFEVISDQEYTGKAIEPPVVLKWIDGTTLTKDVDYKLAYSDNIEIGTATVKAVGVEPFVNEASRTFVIKATKDDPVPPGGYLVTFDVAGGTAVGSQYVNPGDLVEQPADPTRKGYTFEGWMLKGAPYDFSTPVNAALTLVAQWKAAESSSEGPVDPDPEPGVDPDPGSDPKPDSNPEPGTDPEPEPGTDPDSKPGPEPGADPSTPEPGADPEPEPGTDPDPDPEPSPANPDGIWVRLSGQNALGTMRALVREGWAASDVVVVATIDGYWDALAASSIAGAYGAPVLLTAADELSYECAVEVERLGASHAIIVGGTASVSEACADQIRDVLAGERIVERYAGRNAQVTAVAVANQIASNSDTCIVAASSGYWDALSASAYAYAKGAPIYLANEEGALASETLAAMSVGDYSRAIIAGGSGSVAAHTEGDLANLGIDNIQRKAGMTAVDTSVALAEFAIEEGLSANFMGVATDGGYWDALTGGPLCGIKGGVLVLANDANVAAVSLPTANRGAITRAYLFGGRGSLSDGVYAAYDATTR